MSTVAVAGFTLGASAILRGETTSPKAGARQDGTRANVRGDDPAVVVSLSDNAKKDFATVAKDARALLDLHYLQRGGPLDEGSSDADWRKAFSSLDRRSLFAIASNEGGQFSETEQAFAKSLMAEQRKDALSLGNVQSGNPEAARRAAVKFLDGLSDEEKATIGWTRERVASQTAHEILSDPFAKPADDVRSDSPLARFIKAAYAARSNASSSS